MQDGIPDSHRQPEIQQSIPARVPWKPTPNTRRMEQSVSPTANLLLLGWKNTHRGQGPPGNHISGRQFSRYQRGKEYNKGLVRKDSSGLGKSHRDTTAEGQLPSPFQQGNSWLPEHPLFVCPTGTTRAKLFCHTH